MSSDQAAGASFFGALKKGASLFVQFDEPEAAQTPTTFKTAPRPVGSTSAPSTSYDPAMLSSLSKAIMARKTPYTALLEASQKLEKVIPDETMRIKAAFATLGDRSAPEVIQAIDVHVADLEGERLRFKQASERNVKDKSGTVRAAATAKESQLANNTARIQQLRDEANQLEQVNHNLTVDVSQLVTQADAAEADIRAVEARFNATVDFLKKDLASKKSGLDALLS